MDRLDEEKLELLRTWGEGLLADGRDELRAAGRAILLLVEEVELLNVDLWHERQAAVPEVKEPVEEPEEASNQLGSTLLQRIGGRRRRRSVDSPEL
jgi:hypothetical protein